jgi:hypothetical protein
MRTVLLIGLLACSSGPEAETLRPFKVENVVVEPVPSTPCAGEYTANTQVSWVRKVIVIDRFYSDGTREVLRTPFDEVEGIEIETVPHPGGVCSVVSIVKTDGSRLRYAESLSEDLTARAYKFANELHKTVAVKR